MADQTIELQSAEGVRNVVADIIVRAARSTIEVGDVPRNVCGCSKNICILFKNAHRHVQKFMQLWYRFLVPAFGTKSVPDSGTKTGSHFGNLYLILIRKRTDLTDVGTQNWNRCWFQKREPKLKQFSKFRLYFFGFLTQASWGALPRDWRTNMCLGR